MDINNKAPLVARKEVIIQAAPSVVWQKLADPNSWRQWHPDVDALTMDGPPAVGASFALKGGPLTWQATLRVLDPERQMVWAGGTTGIKAIHRWEMQPQGEGTLVITEESLQGWLAWVFKFLKPQFLEEALAGWLAALQKATEAAS